MRSCLAMDPDEGYSEARRLLKNRFGESYRIATAYVDKVTKGPPIKAEDSRGLQNLSTLVTSSKNTLRSIGHSSKIENPDSLKAVIERLPYDLQRKWRSSADRISEGDGKEIKFDDIVEFVEKEARTSAHPVFGDISTHSRDQERDKKKRPVNRPAGQSYGAKVGGDGQQKGDANSRTSGREGNCVMSKGEHKLEDCPDFRSKGYDERVKFAWSKYLCSNFLIPDHRAYLVQRRTLARTVVKDIHGCYTPGLQTVLVRTKIKLLRTEIVTMLLNRSLHLWLTKAVISSWNW